LLVDGQREGPHVIARAIAPALVAPGLVARLAGLRNRVVLPHLLAGHDVEAPRVAVLAPRIGELRADVRLPGAEEVRADDDAVPVDRRGADVRHVERDLAVRAEALRAPPVRRIEGDQLAQRGKEDPRPILAVTRPIAHAA